MGTFDGLQIGSTGLSAQRRGVETAGQNIANVNTPGYTRQRVDITADSGPITPAFHSTWTASGLGVRSVEVTRLRDAFVDSRMRAETALSSQLDARATAYSAVERIFNEPSNTGFAAILSDFAAGWDDLANNPGDIGARTQVVERGVTLANDLNRIGDALTGLQDANRVKLETTVAQVNADAAQVAKLQEAIKTARAAGTNASELQDQRDLLLERIASAVGGTVRHEDDGTATMFVAGTALIRGDRSVELAVQAGAGGTASVVWALDGREAGPGGAAAGLLEIVNTVVPGYRDTVATIAEGVATTVNDVHDDGFDQDGLPGGPFFEWDAATSQLRVADDVRTDPRRIAVSLVPSATGNLDASNAQQMIDALGATEESYRELIVGLGVESQAAQRRVQLQGDVVAQVRSEQEAANGVSLDEELSDLVRFQRAYEASSRFITVVDEILNTLINSTGVIGR